MTLYLAVDGGNSKTDAVVGADDGRVLGHARGLGTCHQTVGLEVTMTRLRALVAQLRDQAGVGWFDRADLFLAGADLPAEVELLTRSVVAEGWATTVTVANDTDALLRAGTDAADAVVVVCGAGINSAGRAADGRVARFPSLGTLSGDWGGGGHLAKLALWSAIRGEDGRGPATTLSTAIADHFGLSTSDDVGAALHLGQIDRSRLSELTPVLFTVAATGDPVAAELVQRQVTEIVSMATVIARRLDLLDSPFTVVLGGGVLRARHPLLVAPVIDGLVAAAPKVTITIVDAPPVLGAALSSLDALDASPAAHVALRAAF